MNGVKVFNECVEDLQDEITKWLKIFDDGALQEGKNFEILHIAQTLLSLNMVNKIILTIFYAWD